MAEQAAGTILWHDLTVEDAAQARDFYAAVIGWQPQERDMGGYADFDMIATATGECAAGICHARRANKNLPAEWLVYFAVISVKDSIDRCRELGGEVLAGPVGNSDQQYCVIRDPAGAVCALMGPE